jgi:hypothetical protein
MDRYSAVAAVKGPFGRRDTAKAGWAGPANLLRATAVARLCRSCQSASPGPSQHSPGMQKCNAVSICSVLTPAWPPLAAQTLRPMHAVHERAARLAVHRDQLGDVCRQQLVLVQLLRCQRALGPPPAHYSHSRELSNGSQKLKPLITRVDSLKAADMLSMLLRWHQPGSAFLNIEVIRLPDDYGEAPAQPVSGAPLVTIQPYK